jgi:hypothetical protein
MIGKVALTPIDAILLKDPNIIFAPNPYVKLTLDN